jgi:hypothetical protein
MLEPVMPEVVMVWLTGLGAPHTLAPELLLPPLARSAALLRTILKKNK